MMHRRLCLALGSLACLVAVVDGCTEDSGTPNVDGLDASLALDAASGDAAGKIDAPGTPVDDSSAPVDGAAPDVVTDSAVNDAGSLDAAPDVVLTGCDLGQACCAGNLCQNDHRCLGTTCSCAQGVAGDYVIRTGGTLATATGSNSISFIPDGGDAATPLTGVTHATDLQFASCALRDDGTVWCWNDSSGGNSAGILGQGDTVNYAVRRALAVKMAPDAGAGATLTDVIALSNGASCYGGGTVCAIRTGGSVWCWGDGDLGILPTATSYPRLVSASAADGGPLVASQVTVGRRHACFLAQGDVYCWGSNVYGSLGRGNPPATPTVPLKVIGLPAGEVTKITTGFEHTCAQLTNGELYCWGLNNYGQLGIGTPAINCSTYCEHTAKRVETSAGVALTGVVDIQAMYHGTCATRAGGELYCWGDGSSPTSNYATAYRVADAGVTGVLDMTYCGSGGFGLNALLSDGGSIGTGPITCP